MSTTMCSRCGMHLIIGVTGELFECGEPDPGVRCLNCGLENYPLYNVAFDPEDYDDAHEHIRDLDDPEDWIGFNTSEKL